MHVSVAQLASNMPSKPIWQLQILLVSQSETLIWLAGQGCSGHQQTGLPAAAWIARAASWGQSCFYALTCSLLFRWITLAIRLFACMHCCCLLLLQQQLKVVAKLPCVAHALVWLHLQYARHAVKDLRVARNFRQQISLFGLHVTQEGGAQGKGMGSIRALAAFRGVVAVGYSTAVVGVLMPRGLSADGHPSGSVPPLHTPLFSQPSAANIATVLEYMLSGSAHDVV